MLKQFSNLPKYVARATASFASMKEVNEEYYKFVATLAEKGKEAAQEGQPAQVQKLVELYGEDVIKADAALYTERTKVPMHLRPTLTYKELVAYDKWREALPKDEKKKYPTSLEITGGKGRSLSLMDDVVDVPPGFNVTTAAYFQFVRDNQNIYQKIEKELGALDTMDDQKRDIVSAEIRDVIKKGIYPENIKNEVLAQYRLLSYARCKSAKLIPTNVAVRSSGTKEDIKVESWLPITTGSQAGQSDTFLNVKGDSDVLQKLQFCWASLFTDRAVSYRDDAIFLIWSAIIGYEGKKPKDIYMELITKMDFWAKKLENQHMKEIVEVLQSLKNPGSVNIMECIQLILEQGEDKQLSFVLNQLKTAAQEVVHPQQIGIDVVIMQMVQSYISGVLFTVNPPTRQAGVAQALWQAWNKKDKSLCHLDKKGQIHGTRPIIMSFEVAFGYGENVVGGKVDPDRFVTATYNGNDWFVLEKKKGTKLIQMIDIEESLNILDKNIPQASIRDIAKKVGKIVEYIEIGKKMAGMLTTHLYGLKYFKAISKTETDHEKRKRMQIMAGEVADLIKAKSSEDAIKEIFIKNFEISEGSKGITQTQLDKVLKNAFKLTEDAFKEAEIGKADLVTYFDGNEAMPEDFLLMMRETWENNIFKINLRKEILKKFKLDDQLFGNLAYTIRCLIDGTFTCNQLTQPIHRNEFCISDTIAFAISRMAWNIANYYEEKMDVEFAIEIDPNAPEDKKLFGYAIDKEGQRIKVKEDGSIEKINKEAWQLKQEDATVLRLYNVQARPYTAGHATVDFVRERVELHEKVLKNLPKELAKGTMGDNATIGYSIVFDPNKTIDQHADLVRRLKRGEFVKEEIEQLKKLGIDPNYFMADKTKKLPIVLYLLEADPSHDPLMRLVNAVVTIRGGETCHAAIFCREQGIPAVCGVGKFELQNGEVMIVNANSGRIYRFNKDILPSGMKFEEACIPVKARIKPYLIPYDAGDTKSGYILAAESVAQQLSPTMLAPDSSGIALSRAEFKGEELGINVVAGYAYDLIQKVNRGQIKEESMNNFQKGLVQELRNHPWIIDQIDDWLKVVGYQDFRTYVENGFYYFYNNLGFHLAPNQINKARAYDFAQDKVQGLIGSEVFSWKGHNPLVGLRGASLEIKDVVHDENYNIQQEGYQEILSFLVAANLKANINTGNQGWFYVFLRTERELLVIANIIREIGKKYGALPAEFGIMVEVPSCAMMIEKLGKILKDLEKDCAQYGLKKVFFSFGTNDYTNLAGKTDREDPRIQNLKILDPAAKKAMTGIKKQYGLYLDDKNFIVPTALEGADSLVQLIEQVCAYGFTNKVDLSLCGQAIVKLIEIGQPEMAGKIMSLLNSFGVDPKNRLPAGILRFDSMRMLDVIKTPTSQRKEICKLSKVMGKGVVKGEVVFIEKDEDFIPKELRGLGHDAYDEKKRLMQLNNPRTTSRVGDKIVFLTGKVSKTAVLEKRGIDWDDLQYARAIIVDPKLKDYAKIMDIFDEKKGITAKRVKGFGPNGLAKLRSKLDGKKVTIEYKTGKVYSGELKVELQRPVMRTFDWVKEAPQVTEVDALCESANDAYLELGVHPLVFMAYKNNNLNAFEKSFFDHCSFLFDEAQKIHETTNVEKKAFLLKIFGKKLQKENGAHVPFFQEVYKDVSNNRDFQSRKDQIRSVCKSYFDNLKAEIKAKLGSLKVEEFIYNAFKNNMQKGLDAAAGKPLVHRIGTLNCTQFALLKGGLLVEQINPNPDYGLLGASRSLSDLWQISRLELKAFKDLRQENKNLMLEISELKGVQSLATTGMFFAVLKDLGLVAGKDGLEVGVQICTPADTVVVEDYLKQGATFVTYDKLMIGAAWAGVDIYWSEWEKVLARKWELEEFGDQAIRFIKSKVDKVTKSGKFGEKKVVNYQCFNAK